ncbi:hypothetical protein NE237_018855 [Protea cynaroides]|uniref:Uncharacterized protein n=1 Tax=Protea cynaroides TaxID=273540 RepID=A0A9Q0KAV9_9MAGN|nr:hypothetical protein NE237_018855 [Protea cynaroides]
MAEQLMATVGQNASRLATSIVSLVTVEEGRLSALLSSQNGKIEASVQRSLWEIDGLEFAGDEDDLLLDYMSLMPRFVFGGDPTLEEAKEATSELKDALDQRKSGELLLLALDSNRLQMIERKEVGDNCSSNDMTCRSHR